MSRICFAGRPLLSLEQMNFSMTYSQQSAGLSWRRISCWVLRVAYVLGSVTSALLVQVLLWDGVEVNSCSRLLVSWCYSVIPASGVSSRVVSKDNWELFFCRRFSLSCELWRRISLAHEFVRRKNLACTNWSTDGLLLYVCGQFSRTISSSVSFTSKNVANTLKLV